MWPGVLTKVAFQQNLICTHGYTWAKCETMSGTELRTFSNDQYRCKILLPIFCRVNTVLKTYPDFLKCNVAKKQDQQKGIKVTILIARYFASSTAWTLCILHLCKLWNIHTLQSELYLLYPFSSPIFAHIAFQKVFQYSVYWAKLGAGSCIGIGHWQLCEVLCLTSSHIWSMCSQVCIANQVLFKGNFC